METDVSCNDQECHKVPHTADGKTGRGVTTRLALSPGPGWIIREIRPHTSMQGCVRHVRQADAHLDFDDAA